MAGLFGGSRPNAAAAPPAPERTAQQIADAGAKQRDEIYGGSPGRVSTLLTGGLGVTSGVNTTVSRLLGNVGR